MLTQKEELTGLIRVLKYFAFFRYAATADDIYVSYPYKITRKQLVLILKTAVQDERILTDTIDGIRYYAMPSHGISLHEVAEKISKTKEKLQVVSPFLSAVKYIAPVYLIGLSGSLAMQNGGKNDDVDFFVISGPNNVWTARLLLLAVASFLGLRRKRGEVSPSGKVCLNLFFDGSDLQVPEQKRNLYVAHEIVHMKPLYMKGDIYGRFLKANEWIYGYLPNARGGLLLHHRISTQTASSSYFRFLEPLFKKLQQYIIAKHRTNELVSDSQMWFYPDDFEEKLRRSKMI